MVVIASAWPAERKAALVARVFDRPHRFTRDDIAFTAEAFGLDEAACRGTFLDAPKLGAVMLDGVPLYLFAVSDAGHLSTASEERLEGRKLYLTRALMRWSRGAEGRAFLAGAIGFAETGDLARGVVSHAWARAMGFAPYATAEFRGHTYQLYSHRG